MSNNSVILTEEQPFNDFSYIPEMAKRIRDNGEPGMINTYNMQKFGRYGKSSPDAASLCNPCGEPPLENFELCNLAETFPSRCKNAERFYKALRHATYYASTVALLPSHRPETNEVIVRNRRIGVSISGIAQWATGFSHVDSDWGAMNYTKMTKFLREGYKIVKQENVRLAQQAGVPPSVRVTTIKPSGSISLLAGCTPGVHYLVSRFAIRRMRIGKDSPLVDSLIKAKPPHEDDTYSDNTLFFLFAIDHGDVRSVEVVSPWEQFGIVSMLQRCWADNMVSATIYFDKHRDGDDIEKMLAMFIPVLKSVSMLPHSGLGYAQAPYEPIGEDQYEQLKDAYQIPDFNEVKNNEPAGTKFCDGDTCAL
jgi:ribonucleoside-diphosphate reductase alpha chain